MLTSTLTIIGTGLIISGIRGALAAARPITSLVYPRMRPMLDPSTIGRMGARALKTRKRLRYSLVAVNTWIEHMEAAHHGAMRAELTRSNRYKVAQDKRAVLESLLYS